MSFFKKLIVVISFLAAGCTVASNSISPSKESYQAHTRVDLVSPSKSIKPGEVLWIGLRMRMDPQWHVYWKNPGDSGLQPTIRWDVPQELLAGVGEIQWPYPKLIFLEPLMSYGYEDEVILFSPIKVPQQLAGSESLIKARVDWLACKVGCIPGRADLELRLPIKKQTTESNPIIVKDFQNTQKKWPLINTNIKAQAYEQNGEILLEIGPASAIKPNSKIYFFPDRADVIEHAIPQNLKKVDNIYLLTIKKSSLQIKPLQTLSGILVNQSGWDYVDYPQAMTVKSTVKLSQPPFTEIPTVKSLPLQKSAMTLVVACIFALFGGLILNLMPCVLPVLSLKILHLVEHSRNKKKSLNNGLLFAAGIIISFWMLALFLILLRSLGSAIGWGFQFQSPAFVVFIAIILFCFSLNLFGLFEVGTGLLSLGNAITRKNGYTASFWSGVLATIVATPCTAPFMGTALSFALSRSPGEAFIVFSFLGIGMALPVVFLSRYPKFLKMIPKPGPWMNTLKAVLGFILLGSVIWLVWVFGMQKGIHGISSLLSSFLILSIGLFFYGKSQISTKNSFLIYFNSYIFIIAGLLIAWYAVSNPALTIVKSSDKSLVAVNNLPWENYSPQLFKELKESGKPFFINFTAAWCLSCQVNDRLALSDARVIKAFKEHRIRAVKADWTNNDPAITAALASYSRNSIPLYVLYSGDGAPPAFLPEIITKSMVLNFLQNHLNK